METATRRLGACGGLVLLAACSDAGATPRDAARDEVSSPRGGETSEFSGGNLVECPEVLSRTTLDLEAADVRPWVQMAEGHHELTLRWQRAFLDASATGIEERTGVVLDIRVLQGEDVLFGTGGDTGYETSGCRDLLVRKFELDVELRTEDGALAGTFRHWVERRAGDLFTLSGSEGVSAYYPLEGFSGALDIGLDSEPGATGVLLIFLRFGAGFVRGQLEPIVSLAPSTPADGAPSWAPLRASFPDDDCGLHERPTTLDVSMPFLNETARAALERFAAAWQARSPMRAAWQVEDLELPRSERPLVETEVTLSIGAPTLVCQAQQDISIRAPVRLESADGKVAIERPAKVGLAASSSGVLEWVSPWIVSTEFEQSTGIPGVNLGTSEYARMGFFAGIDYTDDVLEGELGINAWQDYTEQRAAHPVLHWCGGECDFYWCSITAVDPEVCVGE